MTYILVPPLQKIFAIAPLSGFQWLALLIFPPLLLAAEELRKMVLGKVKARKR